MTDKSTYKYLFDQHGHISQKAAYQYVFGNMSDVERQVVDKHTGACDMCLDLIEGIQHYESQGQAIAAVDRLQERVKEATLKRKKNTPAWQKYSAIAAVLLVLFGGAVMVTQLILPGNAPVAMEEKSATPVNREPVKATTPEIVDGELDMLDKASDSTDDFIEELDIADTHTEGETSIITTPVQSTRNRDRMVEDEPTNNELTQTGRSLQKEAKKEADDPQYERADTNGVSNDQDNDLEGTAPTFESEEMAADNKGFSLIESSQESTATSLRMSATEAQSLDITENNDLIATFPGGENALAKYLSTLKLPDNITNNESDAQKVATLLHLNENGTVRKVSIINAPSRKVATSIEEHLLKMPAWQITNQNLTNKERIISLSVILP